MRLLYTLGISFLHRPSVFPIALRTVVCCLLVDYPAPASVFVRLAHHTPSSQSFIHFFSSIARPDQVNSSKHCLRYQRRNMLYGEWPRQCLYAEVVFYQLHLTEMLDRDMPHRSCRPDCTSSIIRHSRHADTSPLYGCLIHIRRY